MLKTSKKYTRTKKLLKADLTKKSSRWKYKTRYIDNIIGDRLAELGAMAAIIAAESAHNIVDKKFKVFMQLYSLNKLCILVGSE